MKSSYKIDWKNSIFQGTSDVEYFIDFCDNLISFKQMHKEMTAHKKDPRRLLDFKKMARMNKTHLRKLAKAAIHREGYSW